MVRAPPLQDWAHAAPGSVHKVAFSTLAGMSMPTLFGEAPLSESRKGSADGFVGSEWGRASRDPPREAHRGGPREGGCHRGRKRARKKESKEERKEERTKKDGKKIVQEGPGNL